MTSGEDVSDSGSAQRVSTTSPNDVQGVAVKAERSPKVVITALTIFVPVLLAFTMATALMVITAYGFGDGTIYIDDKTIGDMSLFEVTGGAALGVVAAIIGVVSATVGTVIALIAGIIGLLVGGLGLILGSIVVIGVVTGPLLLVAAIGVVIKRRFWPDVI